MESIIPVFKSSLLPFFIFHDLLSVMQHTRHTKGRSMLNQDYRLLFSALPAPAPENREDISLARRAARDPDAFTQIYERYLPRIYRYHLIRTRNVQDAQDLASQTFITALESIGSFRGLGSLAGWLFGIASHKLADYHRHKPSELPLDISMELSGQDPLPEEVTFRQLDLELVANTMRVIAPERAEALALRIFGNLSTIEVAQVMKRSIPAVKMLISRGLSDLNERLACHWEVKS
jgi:RNA polymerase sigma-70 factor (ECF subfamily)